MFDFMYNMTGWQVALMVVGVGWFIMYITKGHGNNGGGNNNQRGNNGGGNNNQRGNGGGGFNNRNNGGGFGNGGGGW